MSPAVMEALQTFLGSPWALALAELVWAGLAAGWMLRERRSPAATLAWILALASLPVVGALVYYALGPRRLRRKRRLIEHVRGKLARELREAAASSPDPLAEVASPAALRLGGIGREATGAPLAAARSLRILADGDACYDALVEAIGDARDHVHAEYYIFSPDAAGGRIRDALVGAALRRRPDGGRVRVRLLLDAAGSAQLRALPDRGFLRPLVEAGGEVAFFNPTLSALLGERAANFRTHRKLVVVDGAVGFLGGMNVADDHSRAARGDAAWRDTHLRLDGEAVRVLQTAFLESWDFARGLELGPVPVARLRPFFPPLPPLPPGCRPHAVQIVTSAPDQRVPAVEALYVGALGGARERAWLTTPYLVPGEPLFAALRTAALRGVDVRLLVPAATDSAVVDAASRTYFDALRDARVKLFHHGPPMIHAKTAVVDDDLAIIGSANLDNRSMRLNFEVVAAIYGGPAVAELAGLFERDLLRARPAKGYERDDPWHRRLQASACRLLAPLL